MIGILLAYLAISVLLAELVTKHNAFLRPSKHTVARRYAIIVAVGPILVAYMLLVALYYGLRRILP